MEDGVRAGVRRCEEVLLIGGSTRIPYIREMIQKLFGGRINEIVNPDEAVASGAAIVAAMKDQNAKGYLPPFVINEITARPLGMKVFNKSYPLIAMKSRLPADHVIRLTGLAGHLELFVELYDGAVVMGTVTVSGLNPFPSENPIADVKFEVDISGMLLLTVTERTMRMSPGKLDVKFSGLLSRIVLKRLVDKAASRISNVSRESSEYSKLVAIKNIEQYVIIQLPEAIRQRETEISGVWTRIEETKKWIQENEDKSTDELRKKLNEMQIACEKVL